MLKILILPFALMIMGLIIVAVFLPKNKQTGQLAVAVQDQCTGFPWMLIGAFLIAGLLPLPLLYTAGTWTHPLMSVLYPLYGIVLTSAALFVTVCYLAVGLFAAAVPVAQELGAGMTKAQRRSVWRRASRAFQKFRAS